MTTKATKAPRRRSQQFTIDPESGTFIKFALTLLRDLVSLRIDGGSAEETRRLRTILHQYVLEHQDPAPAGLLQTMIDSLPWRYQTFLPVAVVSLGLDGSSRYIRTLAGELDAEETKKELLARRDRLEQDLRGVHHHLASLQVAS